jgi:hypothetical protein
VIFFATYTHLVTDLILLAVVSILIGALFLYDFIKEGKDGE